MLGHMRAGAQERKRQLHNMVAAEVAHLDEIEEKYQEEKRALDAADREEWISEQQSYNRKILYPLPTDPAALVAIYVTRKAIQWTIRAQLSHGNSVTLHLQEKVLSPRRGKYLRIVKRRHPTS